MCGIHGVVQLDNIVDNKQCAFIREGFIAGALRGMDSSGIFQLDKRFKAFTHKKAIAGPDFVYTKMADRFIRDTDTSRLTVCHVRHATIGKVEEDNAHPFIAYTEDEKDWVIGVHNGTLDSTWKQKPGGKDFVVDSEWALSHIALKGNDAFKDFKGAWCFVWWDSREKNKFFICANDQRPMHFRLTKNRKQMYFASEPGMLAWLTERNKVDHEPEVYVIEKDKIYEFDMSGTVMTWKKVDMPKPAYTPVYVTPTKTSSWNSGKDMEKFLDGIKEAAAAARDVVGLTLAVDNTRRKKDKDKLSLIERDKLAQLVVDSDDLKPETTPFPLAPPVGATPLVLAPAKLTAAVTEELASETATEKVIREVAEAVAEGLTEQDPMIGTTGAGLKDSESAEWVASDNWYNPSTATLAEQTTAAFWGLTGEVHWFHGTSYDPEKEELWGEVRDYISGKGHVEYAAVIRGVNARHAAARYINNRDPVSKIAGDYAAICGVNEDPILGKIFIMAELSEEGLKKYKQKAN